MENTLRSDIEWQIWLRMCLPAIVPFPVSAAVAQYNAAEKQFISIWEEGTSWNSKGKVFGNSEGFWGH